LQYLVGIDTLYSCDPVIIFLKTEKCNHVKSLYKSTALVLGLLLIAFILRYAVVNSGVLDDIDAASNKECTPIIIAPGTEDIVVDSESGTLYVSAYNRRAADGKDGIYAFNPDKPEQARLVSVDAPADFHPHGISFWSDGIHKQIFAVSHRTDGSEVVEIFSVTEDGDLAHKKTVKFAAMHSPNDVQAVAENAFYVTNDSGGNDSAIYKVLSYLGLSLSSVAFYDGEKGRIVADDLSYANGINMSPDGRYVYVAESLPRSLRVYSRNTRTNELEWIKDIALTSSPDNIDVDEEGRLWIGGHPNMFKYLAYKKDSTKLAPSHVLKVDA
jgi:arylesterase/paraoxonase